MLQKILVPLDGSKLAEKALPYAESLAQQYKGELILVWVLFHPRPVAAGYGGIDPVTIDTMVSQDKDMAEAYLKDIKEALRMKQIPTQTVILEGYDVAEAIVDLAETEKADVIVKTTHGRSGLRRWLFGNVALKVLQSAPCPVFLVRISEEERED